jgi:hypothetical protein
VDKGADCLIKQRTNTNNEQKKKSNSDGTNEDENNRVNGITTAIASTSTPSKECLELMQQKDKCYSTVEAAYHHINLGGCIKQLQAETVCREEYCEDNDNNRHRNTKECREKCDQARESIETCTKRQIETYLTKAGLNVDII